MNKEMGGNIINKEEVAEQVNGEDMVCTECGNDKFTKKKSVTHLKQGVTATVVGLPVCTKCGKEYKKPKKA